ncbi:hypothetical protein [Aquibacillus kalidii]|nr:hypothetical protein [Aquibacillus kalidii]
MKEEKIPYNKSYESDGVMGKDKQTKKRRTEDQKKPDDKMFFNITESSE